MRCFIWGLDLSERLTDEKNMSEKSGTIIRRDDARVLHAFGEEVTILLDGEQTAGKLTMWTEITPPSGGPPPHYHSDGDEMFHVLEGRVAFLSDGEWHEVGPGGAAYMPRGVVHTFKKSIRRELELSMLTDATHHARRKSGKRMRPSSSFQRFQKE